MVGTYEIWINYNGQDENTFYTITVNDHMERDIPGSGVKKSEHEGTGYEVKYVDGLLSFCVTDADRNTIDVKYQDN